MGWSFYKEDTMLELPATTYTVILTCGNCKSETEIEVAKGTSINCVRFIVNPIDSSGKKVACHHCGVYHTWDSVKVPHVKSPVTFKFCT